MTKAHFIKEYYFLLLAKRLNGWLEQNMNIKH